MSELLAERASDWFVGRQEELSLLHGCLEADSPLVLHCHGIAGVGKSTLLQAFSARARERGVPLILLDCRLIEPTQRGFLQELGAAIGRDVGSVEEAASHLERLGDRVVVALDTYEVFRLMDTWLRRVFVPALGDNVRVILVGRQPPVPAWFISPQWQGLFQSTALGPLSDREALELLSLSGLEETTATRINRFAGGHPLALRLAAAAAMERPGLDLEEVAAHSVVQQLTHLFLADVRDPLTRRALEAGSVARRITRSLLGAMLHDATAQDAFERLSALPLVEGRRDGLRMHDAVHDAVAAALRADDPSRYRDYRRAAWRQLRTEVRTAGISELWRYTADMLYLIENPVAREAFFPSGAQELAVEPAGEADGAAIQSIAELHEGPEAARLLAFWWSELPRSFHVVRDRDGSVVGFYCMFDPGEAEPVSLQRDPLVQAWSRHLRTDPLTSKQRVLFLRRWLSREDGESPSPVQAACWLDVKRTYMELRPSLRRVYLTVIDLPTYAPVAVELGFRPLAEAEMELDDAPYYTAMLDFGPSSVDGWLARLVAAELGIEEGSVLDLEARELVLDDRRTALTKLEFEVMSYLCENEGKAVSRVELLEKVWGYEYAGGSNVVDAVVRTLRKKLGERAPLIETVRGVGYRFHAD